MLFFLLHEGFKGYFFHNALLIIIILNISWLWFQFYILIELFHNIDALIVYIAAFSRFIIYIIGIFIYLM